MIFQPKVRIDILTKHYRIHTVTSAHELQEVLELRSKCFAHAPELASHYDYGADHLVVRSIDTQEICGSYAITCSEFSDFFESSEDFDIQEIKQRPGVKLELAWACIDSKRRDGVVIALLWRGIAEFIRQTKARTVFGVTSLFINLAEEGTQQMAAIQNYLTHAHPSKSEQRVLPALLRAYVRAGAEVWVQPFHDTTTNCYDFMTVLDLKSCPPAIENHFRL